MELTDNEKSILSGISFNSEEIKKGVLGEADMALLLEMRAVLEYLKEKYPGRTFEITGCEPKTGTAKNYNEWFFRAENTERVSAFIAMTFDENGELEIRDDFYGELVKTGIQESLTEILSGCGLPVIQINAGFWEYLGKEYGEGISAGDVLCGKVPAGNDIKIFLDGSRLDTDSYDDIVKKIRSALENENVIGDIYIVVLKDQESDFAKDRLYSKSITL